MSKILIDDSKLFTELNEVFCQQKTYLGSFVIKNIRDTLLKVELQDSSKSVCKIKKGDVVITKLSNKNRPAVVVKVAKEYVIINSITTTNDHNSTGIEHNSRFLEHGYFGYSLSKMPIDMAKRSFICILDSPIQLNKAIKCLNEFYNKQLK